MNYLNSATAISTMISKTCVFNIVLNRNAVTLMIEGGQRIRKGKFYNRLYR